MRKMRSKMQRRKPQGNPNLCKQHQSSMTYLGVWAGSLINLLGSTGPNPGHNAKNAKQNAKNAKQNAKNAKTHEQNANSMRRRMSKMRNQCEDARAKCEDAYPKGTLIYAARLAFLGHDSCICYGIFRKLFTSILHRLPVDLTSTSP